MALPRSLSWAHLRNRNPEHHAQYWRQLRALMTGGHRLLGDDAVLSALVPKHPHEEEDVYKARRARAFNIPYAGEIIGDLVGQLAQDPPVPSAEPDADAWYESTFLGDVDRKGMTLLGYAQAMAREALTTRTAWSLVELPKAGDAPPATLAEQEKQGALRAYVCPLPAEAVIDWEDDEDGELLWACVWSHTMRRLSPGDDRAKCLEVFTFYDRTGWVRFEVAYDHNKPPQDKELFGSVDAGPHSFGAVPLLRLELPEGMWAMDKLFGLARAHFQQRSAFSYAQVRGLFPILTAYLGPEMGGGGGIPSEAQTDPGRATEQKYGVGRVAVFGKDDRLTYTSPPADVYDVAAKDLQHLRDEMHRVTSMMANAMDNSPSAVGRSGASKAQDKHSKELVLGYLGTMLCDHLRDMLALVSVGRAETLAWNVAGFRLFDQVTGDEAANAAMLVLGLPIPSPTFKRVYLTATARRIVAHDATDAELQEIGEEITRNVSDEEFAPLPPRQPPGTKPGAEQDEDAAEGEGKPPASPPPNAPRARA